MEGLLIPDYLLEFGFSIEDDFTDSDIEKLYKECQGANETIEKLASGELSLDDALALCESFDFKPDDTIDKIKDNLHYLGFL